MKNMVIVCLGVLGLIANADSATLARFNFTLAKNVSLSIPAPAAVSSAVTVYFAYSDSPGGFEDPTTRVFDGFEIVSGDDGRSITLSSNSDDPQYEHFLSLASNASDDDIRVIGLGNSGGGGGSVAPESTFLQLTGGNPGPDLAGATIDLLELFIESVFIDASAGTSQLNWDIRGQLRFIGTPAVTVPLPPALVLLASLLPLLGAHRRR